jgi:hypothetical protein
VTASEFAALLGAKQIRRGHWLSRCPAHADKRPSLSIAEGRKHPVVFKCMSAGCTQDEVLRAMGLTWRDLLGDRPQMSREVSGRLQDQQMLYTLRDLRRALVSPSGAHLAEKQWRLEQLLAALFRREAVIRKRLFGRL